MDILGVELQYWIAALAAVGALTVWGLKKYQIIMADGKITLDEVIETLTEGEKLADDVVDAVEDLEEKVKEAKEAEATEAEAKADE